ncbi:MAG: hypothetical protein HYS23_01945 [Geobacter sp.]|nr:hypothetical protein [Geobacter sp.]
MDILLGAKGRDVLAWNGTGKLLQKVEGDLVGAMAYMMPDGQLELLRGLRDAVVAERAFEEDFAHRYSAALQEIELVTHARGLGAIHRRLEDMAIEYFRKREAVTGLHVMCSGYRDRLVQRTLRLAEQEMERQGHGASPVPYAWLGFGSDGRQEQTFSKELNGLLVYGDAAGKPSEWFAAFCGRAAEFLEQAGFTLGSDGMNPRNPFWCRSRESWSRAIREGFEHHVTLTELRPLHGDAALTAELVRQVCSSIQRNSHLLRETGRSVATMPVALGFLGRFRVERSGEYHGMVNLKQFAWLPLVLNVRIMAIQSGITETGTLARLRKLLEEGKLSVELTERLIHAYHEITRLRVQAQIKRAPHDPFLDPETLSSSQEHIFRGAVEAVVNLQKINYHVMAEQG